MTSSPRSSPVVWVVLTYLAVLVFLASASAALAHVPRLSSRADSLESATVIRDPATSRVYYGETRSPGEVWYYRLELNAGERLFLQVLTPGKQGFAPTMAVMGPRLVPEGAPPQFIQIPQGASVIVRKGELGEAEYEPFTPGAYYTTGTVDARAPADGVYYVAVFGETQAGAFGLVVGYEERFTAPAWIRLPADLLSIYAWDGGWVVALAPLVATLAVGTGLVLWRRRVRRRGRSACGWLAVAAGLLFFGTSVTVLAQMFRAAGRSGFAPAMGVTAAFVVVPAVMGAPLVWLGWRAGDSPGVRPRAWMFFLGVVGLGFLAGYFVGPALAIAAAVAPCRQGRRVHRNSP